MAFKNIFVILPALTTDGVPYPMAKQTNQSKTIPLTTINKREPQEKLVGYLYDISKLTYAALVLGAFSPIIGGNNIDCLVAVGGLGGTIMFAFIAHYIMKRK